MITGVCNRTGMSQIRPHGHSGWLLEKPITIAMFGHPHDRQYFMHMVFETPASRLTTYITHLQPPTRRDGRPRRSFQSS